MNGTLNTLIRIVTIAFVLLASLTCYAGNTIWLLDTKQWAATADALRGLELEVLDANDIGRNRGLILIANGFASHLSSNQGTPFGGYFAVAQLIYQCPIGNEIVQLTTGRMRQKSYSYTGHHPSQLGSTMLSIHTSNAIETMRAHEEGIAQMVDDCEMLLRVTSSSKGVKNATTKAKK